jgi:hypothetical protein
MATPQFAALTRQPTWTGLPKYEDWVKYQAAYLPTQYATEEAKKQRQEELSTTRQIAEDRLAAETDYYNQAMDQQDEALDQAKKQSYIDAGVGVAQTGATLYGGYKVGQLVNTLRGVGNIGQGSGAIIPEVLPSGSPIAPPVTQTNPLPLDAGVTELGTDLVGATTAAELSGLSGGLAGAEAASVAAGAEASGLSSALAYDIGTGGTGAIGLGLDAGMATAPGSLALSEIALPVAAYEGVRTLGKYGTANDWEGQDIWRTMETPFSGLTALGTKYFSDLTGIDIVEKYGRELARFEDQIVGGIENVIGDAVGGVVDIGEGIAHGSMHEAGQGARKIYTGGTNCCVLFSYLYGLYSTEALTAKRYCTKNMTVKALLGYYQIAYFLVFLIEKYSYLRKPIENIIAKPVFAYMCYVLKERQTISIWSRVFGPTFKMFCRWRFAFGRITLLPKGYESCVNSIIAGGGKDA